MNRPISIPPAITDQLAIHLRAFATPKADKEVDASKSSLVGKGRLKRKSSRLNASQWVVIFDTETAADRGQALRFGTYQVRKHPELMEAGIFYDPLAVSASELNTLESHAVTHDLKLITHDEFADRIIFGIGYNFRGTFVGFNLPFNI